jgi:hypothetical protein
MVKGLKVVKFPPYISQNHVYILHKEPHSNVHIIQAISWWNRLDENMPNSFANWYKVMWPKDVTKQDYSAIGKWRSLGSKKYTDKLMSKMMLVPIMKW